MIDPALAHILRPADILLVGRVGGVSDVIRAVTHSQYSHVAMVAQSSEAWIVLEATTDVRGVAARKLEVITDDPTVEHLSLRRLMAGFDYKWAELGRDIVKAFWLETGEPYSQKVNLEILLGIPVNAADGVNCAAAVNLAYMRGLKVALIDSAKPTPQAFAESRLLREIWTRP
jgi:hypothetical protein